MNCPICQSDKSKPIKGYSYTKPDRYENYMKIGGIKRKWVGCNECPTIYQIRNYEIKDLEKIYQNGYRDVSFRGETIEQAFKRVSQNDSENIQRFVWFGAHVKHEDSKNILDIGSGIGIWPYLLKNAEYNVTCVEENEHSVNFIYEKLKLTCYRSIYPKQEFDAISLVHVLEHISDPLGFLENLKIYIRPKGYLFIEVPSAEFGKLPKDHDDFNSCHVVSYTIDTLCMLLQKSDFDVKHISKIYYKDRQLTRLLLIATPK